MKKMSLILSTTLGAISIGGMLVGCDDEDAKVVPVPSVSATTSVSPSPFCPSVSVSPSVVVVPSTSVSVSVSPSDGDKNDVKGDGGVAYRPDQPEPTHSTSYYDWQVPC